MVRTLLKFLLVNTIDTQYCRSSRATSPGNVEILLKRDFSLAELLGHYPCLAGSVTVVVAALPSAPEETRTEVR